jgi:hypothetical protein
MIHVDVILYYSLLICIQSKDISIFNILIEKDVKSMILSIYALLGDSQMMPPVTPLDIDNHVRLVLAVSFYF